MKSSIFPAAAICKPYIRLSLDSIPKCTKGKEANIVQPINLFKLALIDTWQKNYCMLFKFLLLSLDPLQSFCSSLSTLHMNLLPTASWKWLLFQIWWPKKLFPELCFCLFFNWLRGWLQLQIPEHPSFQISLTQKTISLSLPVSLSPYKFRANKLNYGSCLNKLLNILSLITLITETTLLKFNLKSFKTVKKMI